MEWRGKRLGMPARAKSDAGSEKDRQEENVLHAAQSLWTLTRPDMWDTSPARHDFLSWQQAMMTLLKPLSRHFEVDDEAVMELWARHYGPSLLWDLEQASLLGHEEEG